MKLEEIYKLAVQMGIEKDPRGKAEIKRLLARNREKYEKLPEKEKQYFDASGLDNPFPDSRILVGDPKTEVKTVLVGIDMEVPRGAPGRPPAREGRGGGPDHQPPSRGTGPDQPGQGDGPAGGRVVPPRRAYKHR